MANQIARNLRKTETIAEKRLWQDLKKLRKQGYHFRRQHPIDGAQHQLAENLKTDAQRDAPLQFRGYRILRFGSGDIRENLDGVILEILAALGAVVKQE
jgi:very-short-patch-repair endonuclease